MDIVNEYLKNNRAGDWFGVKRMHCNDGFSMSVQAHDGAIANPVAILKRQIGIMRLKLGFLLLRKNS